MKNLFVFLTFLGFCAFSSATYCPIPQTPYRTKLQAYLYYDGFPYGSSIEFYCHHGYVLVGSKTSHCGDYGSWYPQPPTCIKKVRCSGRDAPQNGFVNPEDDEHKPGQKIVFSCKKGFILKGRRTDVCQKNGKWAFNVTPKCIKPCFVGDVNDKLIYDKKAYLPGEKITFRCRKPCVLVGHDKFRCNWDGTWEPKDFPVCVNKCYPPNIPNGGVLNKKNFYLAGAYIRYFCEEGYRLTVARKARCMADGQWDTIAVCKPEVKKCPGHLIPNGVVEPQQNWYEAGADIEYHCNHGFVLEGKRRENECLPNGKWAYPKPSCKESRVGSCKNGCTSTPDYFSYTCQCHPLCDLYNNCCHDYEQYCGNIYRPLY